MRTDSKALGLVLGLLVALTSSVGVEARGKGPTVQGSRLDFELLDLAGSTVSSDDPRFNGKVLLVELWGSWCPPCITEIPTLVELQSDYGDRGLVVVGISFEDEEQDEERRAMLRQFVEQQGINYLILDGGHVGDFESALPAVKNVRGLPVEILVDRSGVVAISRNGYGFKKKWVAKLKREIEELLSASPE